MSKNKPIIVRRYGRVVGMTDASEKLIKDPEWLEKQQKILGEIMELMIITGLSYKDIFHSHDPDKISSEVWIMVCRYWYLKTMSLPRNTDEALEILAGIK